MPIYRLGIVVARRKASCAAMERSRRGTLDVCKANSLRETQRTSREIATACLCKRDPPEKESFNDG